MDPRQAPKIPSKKLLIAAVWESKKCTDIFRSSTLNFNPRYEERDRMTLQPAINPDAIQHSGHILSHQFGSGNGEMETQFETRC